MKVALKLSVVLNVGLIASLVFVMRGISGNGFSGASQTESERKTPESKSVIVEPPISRSNPKLFRWEQLESTNYPTYIGNLRSVGCPEQTIHDLITAEVEGLYVPRREQVTNRFSSANALTDGFARSAMETQLEQLRTEEEALLAALLGTSPSSKEKAIARSAPAHLAREKAKAAIVTPLVLRNIDLGALKISDEGMKAVAELRQNFIDQIGGANQDPNDPAYNERWRKAQPEADEMLKATIGITAYQELQAQVFSAESESASKRTP